MTGTRLPAEVITSRYNFSLSAPGGSYVFNARTGTALWLEGEASAALVAHLCGNPTLFDHGLCDEETALSLHDAGFLTASLEHELLAIRATYWAARREANIAFVINPTMDCNMACYYCFEERTNESLVVEDIAAIVQLAERRLRDSGKTKFHVSWFGGEPMLNLPFLEECSRALQEKCRELGVTYSASIASNGTRWPTDLGAFVAEHKLRECQITFDGLATRHNKTRRLRPEHREGQRTPFDETWDLVGRLGEFARVDVRINVDERNFDDVLPFVKQARAAGWMDKPFPVIIYPAKLFRASEVVDFIRDTELDGQRIEALSSTCFADQNWPKGVEVQTLPAPRASTCGALVQGTETIGPDRRLYRCALQLSEPHRAVGTLTSATPAPAEPARRPKGRVHLPVVADSPASNDQAWWDAFDPTTRPRCSQCSFLPLCWSGCPKKHLENDGWAIAERGTHFRANLRPMIGRLVGARGDFAPLDEADQFRTGAPPPLPSLPGQRREPAGAA
jgi:uncharacterized protein